MVRKPSKLFRKGDPFFDKVDHKFLNSIERRLAKLENMSSGTGFNKLLGGGASKSALGVRLDSFEIVALAESLPPFGMANAYYVRHYKNDDSYNKVAIGSNTWSTSSGVEKFVIDLTNTIEVHNLCDVEYSANELGFSPVMPRGEERLNIFIPICPAEISSSSSTSSTSTSGVDSSSSSSSSESTSSSSESTSSSTSTSGVDESSSSSSSSSSTSSSTSTSGVDESSSSSSGIEVRKCFTVVTAVSFNSDTCELIVDTCDLCFPADLDVTLENCSAPSSSSGGS